MGAGGYQLGAAGTRPGCRGEAMSEQTAIGLRDGVKAVADVTEERRANMDDQEAMRRFAAISDRVAGAPRRTDRENERGAYLTLERLWRLGTFENDRESALRIMEILAGRVHDFRP